MEINKFEYECDECEDTEFLNEKIKDGWACECGGSMNIRKQDYFYEVEYIEKCQICQNRDKDNICYKCIYN